MIAVRPRPLVGFIVLALLLAGGARAQRPEASAARSSGLDLAREREALMQSPLDPELVPERLENLTRMVAAFESRGSELTPEYRWLARSLIGRHGGSLILERGRERGTRAVIAFRSASSR